MADRQNTQIALRKSRIAELLAAKKTEWEIATILQEEGFRIRTNAISDIKSEILEDWRRKTEINAEAIVAEELASLEEMQRSLWDKAVEGHLQTVDRVLKIMEHRAKLLGLYAPEQHRVVGQVAIVKAYVGMDLSNI